MNEKEPVNLVTPPIAVSSNAHISTMDAYQKEYQRSVDDPEGFWSEVAENFHWYKKWDQVRSFTYEMDSPIS